MEDFALLFRQPDYGKTAIKEEETSISNKKWNDWIGGIAAQGKLTNNGLRLAPGNSKVLKPSGVITDGPFVEIREILGGFIVVKVDDLDEAVTLAHGCPIFESGGSVEVRPVFG